MPLGSGALAGLNWEIDRKANADRLGFARPSPNSIDAVSNRDFVLDYLYAATVCATHLSRLGAEIVIWSSSEFGFCEPDDAFASGSSLMPQKKNPDAAELLRAKSARVVGSLTTLTGVLHALPLAYAKDLQEDKEALFDAVDTVELCLEVADRMLSGLAFDRDRMAAAAADEMVAATDVADLLVRKGMPFREAHGVVGGLVRAASEAGRSLSELTPDELASHSELLDDEYYAVLAEGAWLDSKVSVGGTGSVPLAEQIELAEQVVATLR
jgi:argininosuccinate lyase